MTPELSAAIARIRAVASDRHDFDMLPILRRDVLALLSALEEAQAVKAIDLLVQQLIAEPTEGGRYDHWADRVDNLLATLRADLTRMGQPNA